MTGAVNRDFWTCGSWQAQHLVNLEVQILWQAQHLVNLEVQISWQVQHLVNLEVQILWQAQHFVTSKCRFRTSRCRQISWAQRFVNIVV